MKLFNVAKNDKIYTGISVLASVSIGVPQMHVTLVR